MSSPDIFISYSREDRPTAHLFADKLGEEGFAVWWDAALHSGETFDEVIERNLRAAKAVVVLWSPRSVASRWVRAEATLADRRGVFAPAIIEPCDRPIIFELTHTAELTHWSGDRDDFAWRQFVTDLHQLVGESAVAQSRQATKPQPAAPAVQPERRHESQFGGAPTAFPGLKQPVVAQEYEATQLLRYDDIGPTERHMLDIVTDGEEVASFEVGPLGLRIGRAAPADVVLDHPGVSRNHCEIALLNGELMVTDLDSTNGTYIDDERISGTAPIAVGSVLQVGGVRLVHDLRSPIAAR
ncbi:TIR domain-containing protein [Croceicoccus bisphenolivorans]|uniref:TIR domain-containing protein n=1 Tax=Croceicoccus bisphenolivorans TaxID=1783232 RepID=UPI000830A8BB|nr:TIR domain-containing protein [Croceicoccus bisphenolivorans]